MSTPQWQNLPVPPNSGDNTGWAAFTVDPRDPQYQHLRASDADRATASSVLAGAYAEGRLDKDEYDQRLSQVTAARSMGELVPVLADVTVAPSPSQPRSGPQVRFAPSGEVRQREGMIGPFPKWWLGLALMFNVIWLFTSFSAGHPIYYWPMWPMLGTAIPMFIGMANGRNSWRHRPEQRPAIEPRPDPERRDLR